MASGDQNGSTAEDQFKALTKLASQLEHKFVISKPLSQEVLNYLGEISYSCDADGQTRSAQYCVHVYAMLLETLILYPQQFMQQYSNISTYLVNTLQSTDVHISTAACKFWAHLPMPPVPVKLMSRWTSTLVQHLSTIVAALVGYIKYHSVLLQHINTDSNSERADLYSDLRNYAAKALENVCRIFESSAVDQLRPLIVDCLLSCEDTSDWCQQEAVLLAFAACIEAVGIPRQFSDLWPQLFPAILTCCRHSQPLVRSMASFLLQHLIGAKLTGCKKVQSEILRETLRQVGDESSVVQEMALRTLTMCLYQTQLPHNALSAAVDKLTSIEPGVNSRSRSAYCDCVSVLVGKCVPVDKVKAESSLYLLLHQWQQLTWTDIDTQPSESMVHLCQPLCAAIMNTKQLFKTHNKTIVDAIFPAFKKLVSVTEKTIDISNHLVAFCDVFSALFEGQGNDVSVLCGKQVLPLVLKLLNKKLPLTDELKQSSLALLGHLCHYDYERVEPHLDTIVSITSDLLTEESPVIRNNILWLLAQLTAHIQRRHTLLFSLVKQLVHTIVFNKDNVVFVINIVVALTNLGTRFSDMAQTTLDLRLFQAICFLLPMICSQEVESIVVSNLCVLLTEHLHSVTPDHWILFCSAIVVSQLDDSVCRKVTKLLRDARVSMDTASWKAVTQRLAQHVTATLRKKFKVF